MTPTVFELGFEPNIPLEFEAGQFISIVIPGAGPKGRDLRRAYSIASPPGAPISLCIKLVEGGPGTNYLYRLRPGDSFKGYAPYGDFVYKNKPNRAVCFISTGTGIAPFHSMIASEAFSQSPPTRVFSYFGVRTEDELLYQGLLSLEEGQKLRERLKLTHLNAISQPTGDWRGFKGRVTDAIRQEFEKGSACAIDWVNTDYYLCGHGGMIQEIKEFLGARGVEKTAIHQEIYYK